MRNSQIFWISCLRCEVLTSYTVSYSRNRRGKSMHQMWHLTAEQKEFRSFKAVRLELRSLCVSKYSSWLALQNAWQLTLFYSVTWRNVMIYTHSHVSFCRLKITVGYLSVLRCCLFGWDVYLFTALLTDSSQCSSRWVFSAALNCYWVWCPARQEILVSRRSTPAVGPTQPPVQRAPSSLTGCVKLATDHLVTKLRMCGAIPPLSTGLCAVVPI